MPVVEADPGNHTPNRTQETYLGHGRLQFADNAGQVREDEPTFYSHDAFPLPAHFAYLGEWTVTEEHALSGPDARMMLNFYATDLHLVMAGEGQVRVTLLDDEDYERVVEVDGISDLDDLSEDGPSDDVMILEFSPGIEAYAFTFG